jgi:hypothetical protein
MQVSKDKTELKNSVIEKAEEIAEVLFKNNDCELRTSPNGVSVIKVKKEVVSK